MDTSNFTAKVKNEWPGLDYPKCPRCGLSMKYEITLTSDDPFVKGDFEEGSTCCDSCYYTYFLEPEIKKI